MTLFSTQLKNAFRYLSDPVCKEEFILSDRSRKRSRNRCPLPHIQVLNPMTHNIWGTSRYTTYDIIVQTQHKAFNLSQTSVSRRFSEFVWLWKQLKSQHSIRTPPDLPPKTFFAQRFDEKVIQERCSGLEKFINRVIQEKLYLSDTVVHLFIQSELTRREMNDFIDGNLSEEFIQNLWASGGKKTFDWCIINIPDPVKSDQLSTMSDVSYSGSDVSHDSSQSL